MKLRSALAVAFTAAAFVAAASPATAVKVVSLAKKAATASKVAKSAKTADRVIDASMAVKNGKKVYAAKDLIEAGVKIGKGMLGKVANGVGDDVVEECAKVIGMNRPGGVGEVGEIIGKCISKMNLPTAERELILNDAYLRIAAKAGRLTGEEADDAFRLLRDAEGLHALIRKCCSSSPSQAAGHLFEFRQALSFQKQGFDVLGLGVKYSDGLKHAQTDLDLLIRKGNRLFLVESKHYKSAVPAPDMIRADADSLISLRTCLEGELGDSAKVTPVFTFVAQPGKLLGKQLEAKGIPYFVGESDDLVATMAALY